MELFLDNRPLTFEKMGMEARLSEEPNEWPKQILDQLYHQAPFTSDYLPRVVLKDVDADRRYGMGHIELLNKLAISPREDATPPQEKGKQKCLVPIVIQEGKLKPLDLLICEGTVEPLTEERLRAALFRPSLFEAIRKRPGDMSMIEQLYPPHRQYGGARGPLVADASGGGMARTAGAKPEFLLDAILPTIKTAQVTAIEDRLNDDPSLRSALLHNDAVLPFLGKLAQVELEQASQDFVKTAAYGISPKVVQVQKIEGGFRIKTANPDALIPTADDVDRPAAVGTLGGDVVSEVERDGTTTITTQPAVKDTLEDLTIKVVNEFGLYKVRVQGEGKEIVGWVFPKVMDLGGELLPLAVFSNGSQSATQENIAGVPLARSTDLIDEKPKDMGCFYYATPSGAQALVPMMIRGEVETDQGISYMGETILGEQCQVVKMPGLKMVTQIGDNRYGMPENVGWMPLENDTKLASSPDEFTKTAEARAMPTAVRVLTDGLCFSFEGEEIDKLAGVMGTKFLPLDDAVFLGTVLGEEPVKLAHVLNNMRNRGAQEVWFEARPVTTFKEKYAEARTAACKMLDKMPSLRTDLLKEAAPMEDPSAVDKILSIGFINPENISIFASYMPEIEASIQKLSELLMASRLGLKSVDEGALQKSLVHLDKVVAGLKTLGDVPQA